MVAKLEVVRSLGIVCWESMAASTYQWEMPASETFSARFLVTLLASNVSFSVSLMMPTDAR